MPGPDAGFEGEFCREFNRKLVFVFFVAHWKNAGESLEQIVVDTLTEGVNKFISSPLLQFLIKHLEKFKPKHKVWLRSITKAIWGELHV